MLIAALHPPAGIQRCRTIPCAKPVRHGRYAAADINEKPGPRGPGSSDVRMTVRPSHTNGPA